MMKTSHLLILIISIFLASLFVIYWFVVSSLFSNMCEISIAKEVSTEVFTATTLSRGCGVGSSDYSFVNIRKIGDTLEDSDYLSDNQIWLRIDSEKEEIHWKDDTTLVINCSECLVDGIEKVNSIAKNDFKDLKIEYQKE